MTFADDLAKNGSVNHIRAVPLKGYVGFDCLPEQLINKTIRNGVVFNVLLVGDFGIGKTTLISALFNHDFNEEHTAKSQKLDSVQLNVKTFELQEKQVRLKLTVIETEGFGGQVNKDGSYEPIVDYIDAQYEKFLQEEIEIHRHNNLSMLDTRVHCCLYFIPPLGHGLRSIDFVTLKSLCCKVNVIPIIAKSDMVSKAELTAMRAEIMSALRMNNIDIFELVTDGSGEKLPDEMIPLGIVASKDFVIVNSKRVRGREYPWGTVQVENSDHCDFLKLRELLLSVNMEYLRDITHRKYYEAYRYERLKQIGFKDISDKESALSLQAVWKDKSENLRQSYERREKEIRERYARKIEDNERDYREFLTKLNERKKNLKESHENEIKKIQAQKMALEQQANEFKEKSLTLNNQVPPNKTKSSTFGDHFKMKKFLG